MPTPVLATKLFAPPSRARLVARPRLLRQLDETLQAGHRLTVVSAPAGFGKTTLLGDWLRSLGPDRARAAWLSLDDGDDDLARFLTHVLAALRGAGLDVDDALLEPLTGGEVDAVLTALVNAVTSACGDAAEGRWVLVLDDYHAVEAREVHAATAFLVDHLPARVHLVVATRADPPFRLPRLRGRGQLVELRGADLRLTPPEARDFLGRVMELDLPAGAVDALEARTEGWVAGLQLAALSLREVPDPEVAGFVAAFTGSSRFVLDFLADEVLARQPAPVRDFLLRTAVLDRLSGPLCDAVLGTTGGAGVLEALERGNLFLVPVDADRTWYRYHHLFADVLRARLLAERPTEVPRLHRRASDWHDASGNVADAVRHALAGGDADRAAHLVEAAAPLMRRTRQDALLLGWMRALPGDAVRRSPVLCILAAWSRLISGDLAGVGTCLDDAEAALAAGAADPALAASWADTEDLRAAPATVAIYRASLAQARGDVPGTVAHARHALDHAGPQDHFVRGAASGFLGLAAWADGDVESALTTFAEAVRNLEAAGNLVDALDSTVVLADLWVAAGRPGRARALYEQALRTAERGAVPHLRAAADLHVGLAELDREAGDVAAAQAHLATAAALAERTSITENRHRRFVASARVSSDRGDLDDAVALLDEAAALYRPGFYPDTRPIAATRARVQLTHGDVAAAEEWARTHAGTAEVTYLREHDHLTLVRLLLARHRRAAAAGGTGLGAASLTGAAPAAAGDGASGTEHLDAALELLDRLGAAAAARAGSMLEIGVLRALALHGRGRRAEALAGLGHALARAPEPEACSRLFLDEGAPMLDLLRDAAAAAGGDAAADGGDAGRAALARHARRLLAAADERLAAGPPVEPGPGGGLVAPLSTRETEVLHLLATELTGPEIARRLYISLNTLRTHTKHIFTKLDVGSRATAVRRARDLGLLEAGG